MQTLSLTGFFILTLLKPDCKDVVIFFANIKIMKKILAIILIAGSLAIKTNAQIRRQTDSTQNVVSNSSKSTERHESMNSLNLTKQQMNQLKELRRNMKQRRDSINNDQSIDDGLKLVEIKRFTPGTERKIKYAY